MTDTEKKRTSHRLTESLCQQLKPPAKGSRMYFDSQFTGLALRVTAAGARSWVLCYRMPDDPTERRFTFGKLAAYSPDMARKKARQILADKVDKGIDPVKERQAHRKAPTLAQWGETYLEEHAIPHKRPGSVAIDRLSIRNLVEHFGKKKKLSQLTKSDIRKFHRTFEGNSERSGNKALATLSHMFTCAIQDEIDGIEVNPVIGIKRFPETSRDRFLNGEELGRFVEALGAFTDETKAAHASERDTRQKLKHARVLTELRLIQFLLLTGARIGEASQAEWSEIDFERGVWTKPSHHTKQKKVEHVPLNTAALELLQQWAKEPKRSVPKESEPKLIFPGSIPTKGITYPRKTFAELKKRAGIKNFKPHDLRHTFASQLVMSGKSLTIVGRLLGHTQHATTQRYAHLADDPMREASDVMGKLIGGISKGKKAEVRELRKRGA